MVASTEWLEKDFYRVLGVSPSATGKEITAAYRRLARRLHPDTSSESTGDAQAFREVAAAYEVLHDPARRQEYDQLRRAAADQPGRGGRIRVDRPGDAGARGGRRREDGRSRGPAGQPSVEDLIADLFGEGVGDPPFGAGGPRRTARPRRGPDLTAELSLPFADAVRGTTRRLTVEEPVPCPVCAGSGRRSGGAGCPACGGSGVQQRTRTVTARIPGGVADGQTISLRGRGAPGADGGPPGDLRIRVRVEPHPFLGRQGDDLTVTVPVTFAEAALGADVRVPTLDQPVTVRVPPGTATGTTFRVRGREVPATARTGDLLVTVEVAVPRQLTDEQRAAVQALAAATPESPRAHLGA